MRLLYLEFFFLSRGVWVFLNSIKLKTYRTFLKQLEKVQNESTEIALKEKFFRIIKFPTPFIC